MNLRLKNYCTGTKCNNLRNHPLYYQSDLIKGARNLLTSVKKDIEIIEGLRAHTTGYAIPQFVIDVPGGRGKFPLVQITSSRTMMRK